MTSVLEEVGVGAGAAPDVAEGGLDGARGDGAPHADDAVALEVDAAEVPDARTRAPISRMMWAELQNAAVARVADGRPAAREVESRRRPGRRDAAAPSSAAGGASAGASLTRW